MGRISIFFKVFINITLVIIRISMSCNLSFKAIFFNNYGGNKYISFQQLHDRRVVIFQNVITFHGTYEMGPGHVIYQCVFFSTKTMGIIHILALCRKIRSWYVCAGSARFSSALCLVSF